MGNAASLLFDRAVKYAAFGSRPVGHLRSPDVSRARPRVPSVPPTAPASLAWNDLFGKAIQIGFEIVDGVELLELASVQCAKADTGRFAQDLQLRGVLGLALLHEAHALTKDLARILVAAGADKRLDDLLLMFR
jgi:hypothetical protein